MSNETIYNVTVEGQYYGNIDGRKTILTYREVFKLRTMDCALSVIKNKLLHARLAKTAPHYTGFRSHKIVGVTTDGDARQPDQTVLNMPIEQMSVVQLCDFCLIRNFSVDPRTFEKLPDARNAVLQANAAYLNDLAMRKDKQAEVDADNSLRDLNDLPHEVEGGSIPQGTPTPPVAPASPPPITSDVGTETPNQATAAPEAIPPAAEELPQTGETTFDPTQGPEADEPLHPVEPDPPKQEGIEDL